MFRFLYPDKYYSSAYIINYQHLYDMGYRGILFDVDNTLVMHDAPIDNRSYELIVKLKEIGFKIALISNNKVDRVEPFASAVDVVFVSKADKPNATGYKMAMDLIGTTSDNTVSIGDQFFTDMWGSNRAKLMSILVKPISKKEKLSIAMKRVLERIILHEYMLYRARLRDY